MTDWTWLERIEGDVLQLVGEAGLAEGHASLILTDAGGWGFADLPEGARDALTAAYFLVSCAHTDMLPEGGVVDGVPSEVRVTIGKAADLWLVRATACLDKVRDA